MAPFLDIVRVWLSVRDQCPLVLGYLLLCNPEADGERPRAGLAPEVGEVIGGFLPDDVVVQGDNGWMPALRGFEATGWTSAAS